MLGKRTQISEFLHYFINIKIHDVFPLLPDIPRSMLSLLKNDVYLVTCLGICCEIAIVSGFVVFLPKYLETQFGTTTSMANLFTGETHLEICWVIQKKREGCFFMNLEMLCRYAGWMKWGLHFFISKIYVKAENNIVHIIVHKNQFH